VKGFHAHDGWYFRRNGDGSVTVSVTQTAQADAPVEREVTVSPETWASIVASVSLHGESALTFAAAAGLHVIPPLPASGPL
jgi:hypothetical protein